MLLFWFCPILFSQSESYTIEPIPKTVELSECRITSVLKDSEGFMWFGTERGLYRYDGLDFKEFYHSPIDPFSLSSDNIWAITEDSVNIIWIASTGGLDRYDVYYDRIERLTDTLRHSPFWAMVDDGKGIIWLGTWGDGLLRFDKRSGRLLHDESYNPTDTVHIYEVREILMDRDGIIWIYSDGPRFWRYDPKSDNYIEIGDVPCKIGTILEDQSGRIWVTSACGLYLFDRKTMTFERQLNQPGNPNRLNNDRVCSIREDRNKNLWITTYDGVYKYSPELRLLYHWTYQNPYPTTLTYFTWHGLIYEDDIGTIWIFNLEGIFKLRQVQEKFTIINPDPPSTNSISSVYILNENTLLMGTTQGYYENNRSDHSFTAYNLSNSKCVCMCKDSHGIVWIGTRNGLYRRIKSDDHTVEHIAYHHIPGDSSSLPGNYVFKITEDSSGKLWIGCQFAMPCYYDRENDCFIHMVDKFGKFQGIHEPYIFHETSKGALVGSSNGAYKIIPPFTRISEHAIVASDIIEIIPWKPFGRDITGLWSTCMDNDGTIWFGDCNMGLFKWEGDTLNGISSKGKWTLYSKVDGLAGNIVNSIEEDLKGILWIGTATGLSRFDPASETFTNFYTQNGLIANYFSKSGTRSPKGELFFGTSNGLISFYPDSIKLNTSKPPIKLTSFKVNNQEVIPVKNSLLSRSILYTDSVKLPYKFNTVSLSFAVLNYIEPERNQHKYMLEGLDEDWVFSGQRNEVTYADLKPGKYTFRATGSNNGGEWNEEGVALFIRVMAPPWLKWWAYLIYGFILTGIILIYRRYLLIRAQLQTDLEVERVEKEKVQELDQLKSRFFANISHEFRTPLTLIKGPIEDLLKSEGKPGKKNLLGMVQRNTGRLQQLINELLELSRIETGRMKLQVSEDDLSGFLRSLTASFLSHAEKKKIEYKINISEESEHLFFDRDKVEKIVTNLIYNALKFTQEGEEVTVDVNQLFSSDDGLDKQVQIIVSDTGPGIPKEEKEKIFDRFHQVDSHEKKYTEGTGIGLALVKELVDLYRGSIELESEIGKGSTFTVVLPASKEQFTEEEILVEQVESEADHDISPDPQIGASIISDTQEVKRGKADAEKPIILVVEDNEDLRKYITQNLDLEYQVVEAEDGRLGIHQALEHFPDLVISDLMMPEMDGIEMCEQLKSDQRTRHIPLIMLTAREDKTSKLDSYDKGADDYIIKPFDADELRSRIKNQIEQRKRLREKYRKEFLQETESIKDLPDQTDSFVVKVSDFVKSNLSDSEYGVEQLCQDVGLSQSQLYRKIMALTDLSPVEFIRNTRLKKAAEMFRNGQKNVSTVLYSVGFNTPSHFSKYFRELFGVNPSDYINKIHTTTG